MNVPKSVPNDTMMQQPQVSAFQSLAMSNLSLGDTDFGAVKPDMSSCPSLDVMIGVGDPMIYHGYNDDLMRL